MGFRVSLMNQLSTKVDGICIIDTKAEKSPLSKMCKQKMGLLLYFDEMQNANVILSGAC